MNIPKHPDGRQKNFAFITFKHDVSVPYTMQLMDGIQLFQRTLRLQSRTGSSHDSKSNMTPPGGRNYINEQMPNQSGFHRSNTWPNFNASGQQDFTPDNVFNRRHGGGGRMSGGSTPEYEPRGHYGRRESGELTPESRSGASTPDTFREPDIPFNNRGNFNLRQQAMRNSFERTPPTPDQITMELQRQRQSVLGQQQAMMHSQQMRNTNYGGYMPNQQQLQQMQQNPWQNVGFRQYYN